MIELVNTGKAVNIIDSVDNKFKIITLAKGFTLKPREPFSINTGIVITCTSDLDECWIWSDPIFDKKGEEVSFSDNIGIITHRITSADGNYSVKLMGGYMGDTEVKIPAGAEIAHIYFSATNPNQIELNELKYSTVYESPDVLVKTPTNTPIEYELTVEPNGKKSIRVDIPA